ncbi:hypothetical protein FRB99_006264, partial [Tulasnella sp. 403]
MLDRQVEVLSQTLRTVEAQIQTRTTQVRKRRNGLCSINRLSVEVLVEIFSFVSEGIEFPVRTDYYVWLARLSRVCTLWAAIIDQAPTLWTILFDTQDPRLVDKIIAKAGNCPLSVSVGRSSWSRPAPESFLDKLVPLTYRWEAAELIMKVDDKDYLQGYLKESSAPKLKTLHIQVVSRRGSRPIDLFRGGTECLQELVLSGTSVPWSSPLLSRLQILRISSICMAEAPRTIKLIQILTQCPDLSELAIHQCYILEPDTSDDLPAPSLPHLRILEL